MKFLGNIFSIKNKPSFYNIEGYSDIKGIVQRTLDSEDNYNLLFCGPPASSKTLFLLGIQEIRKDAIYFDASCTTNRILDVLEQERPKIILLDELDKMSKPTMNQLLNFMESGKVTQHKKQYDFTIKGAKVFATANDISRIAKPLQSRFMKLFLSKYTEEQFYNVAEKVLPKLSPNIARYIGAQVWKMEGDIRTVISVGKLVQKQDGPKEIEMLVNTMFKYGEQKEGQEK